MYCIYCITNEINGKTYIGQHKTDNLDDDYMGSGVYLLKAKNKHEINNFSKKILAVTETKKNIDILERVFIAMYRSEGKAEYNIADGGDGGGIKGLKKSEHMRISLSKSRKGIHLSEETKQKLRNCHLGKKHPHSEETKIKIGNANRGKKRKRKPNLKLKELWKDENYRNKQHESRKGRKIWNKGLHGIYSDEYIKKLSESHKGKHW